MPKVKFTRTAIVKDRKYTPGQEVDLDEDVAKDVVRSQVGVVVGASVRTAEDASQAQARKAVKLGG